MENYYSEMFTIHYIINLFLGNSTFLDGTDPDFVWQDYLEDTHTEAAPPTAFTHVI